jgi:hypothetical protein
MTRFLWAIEEQSKLNNEWFLLPNTVHVRRYYCEFDMKNLQEHWPRDKYRIVKYKRLEKPQ